MRIDTFNGHTILADDSDYNLLGRYTWFGRKFKNTSYAYARLKTRGYGLGPGRVASMHRILMKVGRGEVVHHRNGNGLDNRRANLQITTHRVNIRHAFIKTKCPLCSDPIDKWWLFCAMCGHNLCNATGSGDVPMSDLRLHDLSRKAIEGLEKVLAGRPITLENIRGISQRDIWIMPNFGRKTSNEIKAWAARHGVEMPER